MIQTFEDYADYRKSDKWNKVKQEFDKKNRYSTEEKQCFNCGFICGRNTEIRYHHWRYLEDWNDDSCDNLILLCDQCRTEIIKNSDSKITKLKTDYSFYDYLLWMKQALQAYNDKMQRGLLEYEIAQNVIIDDNFSISHDADAPIIHANIRINNQQIIRHVIQRIKKDT